MKDLIANKKYEEAEKRMNELINIATKKGGFYFLTDEENLELEEVSLIVKNYEDINYRIF